jgi:ribosomal protein S18 acetylase RimI-like enzyme
VNETIIKELTISDLDAIARIHHAAFPKSALGQLGKEAVKRYYRWQLQGPHDAVALGAFREENLAGFCFAGLFRGALSGFLRMNRGFLILRVITHPWLVATPLFRERLTTAGSILMRRSTPVVPVEDAPQKSFGVLSIAVDPQRQGLGVGKQLMLEVERIALERCFSNMHLTVSVNNVKAIKFYEKLDWHKVMAPNGTWHGSMAKHLE